MKTIWSSTFPEGSLMTHQGKTYRVLSVRDNSVRDAKQVMGLKYELTVEEMEGVSIPVIEHSVIAGLTEMPIEEIVSKRYGKPGESFFNTLERLTKGE